MAQKVATARKMKSQQETTSLGQIVTVTPKPTISDKHLQTWTRNVLKFRRATWDPPWQGLAYGNKEFVWEMEKSRVSRAVCIGELSTVV